MHYNGCPTSAFFFSRFPAAAPLTVPVTQCQMGNESSADLPLCGRNPQSFNSGLQVTEAIMKNSELILTSLLKVKRVSHYPPCLSFNPKATVAKGRNVSSLCLCAQRLGLCCVDSEPGRNMLLKKKKKRKRKQMEESESS